ncbi:hypothetical protein SEUCBS139899_001953 [Sporothrix eucalyptigena]
MIDSTVELYGSLDALIYNSGAIWWASVEETPLKRFRLLQSVNVDGLYATVQASLPYFEKNGWKGRIIVVSPPIYSRFFRGKTAYAMGKVAIVVPGATPPRMLPAKLPDLSVPEEEEELFNNNGAAPKPKI